MRISSVNQKISIVAAGIGALDSLYLAILKLTNNQTMCLQGNGDCWTVNISEYSSVYGIPVSIFGLLAYALLLVLVFPLEIRGISTTFRHQMAFGIAFAGFIFSIYLTYLEIAVIKAVCPFCVISAVMMTVLFICTLLRLVKDRSEYTLSLEEKNG